MKRKKNLSGIVMAIVALVWGHANAQTLVRGKVLDAETKAPLAGAVVLQAGQIRGAVTDSAGQFTLTLLATPTTVRVQYLGYKPLVKRMESGEKQPFVWTMEPEALSIPTTTIIDTKLQRVYPDRKVPVIDYDFLGDNILMIVYEKVRKRNVLQLFSPNLRFLAEYDDPQDPPVALVQDCLGARHLLSTHFAGQLDYVGESQLIVRKDSLIHFQRTVAPCLASLDSTYFFAFMPNAYSKGFTYVRGPGHPNRYLYSSIDTEALERVRDEKEMELRAATDQTVQITDASASRAASRAGFQTNLNRQYLTKVQFPPVYIPIKTVESTACIFDHTHSRILQFDGNGREVTRTDIAYNRLPNWKKEVLANEEQTAAFTLTERNGYTTVHRIDLDSGELVGEWELPFQFVQKIKVMGRYIYFTYRDSQYDPIKRLYRLEM